MIKLDLEKKIKELSLKMDDQLRSGNYQDYNRLADTYIKLIREYEALISPKKFIYDYVKPMPYFTTDVVSKNPLKHNEILSDSKSPTCTINITNPDMVVDPAKVFEEIKKSFERNFGFK